MNSVREKLLALGEYSAAGLYEEPDAPLFRRKARAIRRYFENCPLPAYTGRPLYPSGGVPRDTLCFPNYLHGMNLPYWEIRKKDEETANRMEQDFGWYPAYVPAEHTVAGNMYTHSVPNYPRICREGFDSYETRIQKMADADLRLGLLDVLSGIRTWNQRCVAYLKSVGAEQRLIEALETVPFSPAKNLYQAVVSWNFVLYLDNCDNLGALVTGLLPFYRGEDATALFENLFDNLDDNGGYSLALHTDAAASPLTVQCLHAVKGKRRPMIELFVNENTPKEVWKAAFASIRTGNGQPAFYSDEHLDLLEKRLPSFRPEDRNLFCGGGCAESMFTGLSNVGSLDAGINLLLIFEGVMKETLTTCPDFEAFYQAYIDAVRETAARVADAIYHSQEVRSKTFPLPMRTLLMDDCIDRNTEYNAGGARYCFSIVNFAGTINAADAMLFLREHVFEKKDVSAETVLEKCAADDAEFLAFCRGSDLHFGNDNTAVNEFVHRLTGDIYTCLDGKKTYFGDGFVPASIQFRSQAAAGKWVGATPDGRRSKTPLCDSLAAIFGRDDHGPTALLRSVTALRLDLLIGTPILNFNINETFSDAVLKSLILGYQRMGGLQIQITCANHETLLDAAAHPELHKNLVVRVGGFSEYFCRLDRDTQQMVIDRTIQSLPGGCV